MKLTKLTPMLWTRAMDETLAFYQTELDFVVIRKLEDESWALLAFGEVELMVALPPAAAPIEKSMFTGSFYFYVEDVEAYWARLNGRVRIAYPIENFDWGMREFAVYDNNGYMLQFGEEWVVV